MLIKTLTGQEVLDMVAAQLRLEGLLICKVSKDPLEIGKSIESVLELAVEVTKPTTITEAHWRT